MIYYTSITHESYVLVAPRVSPMAPIDIHYRDLMQTVCTLPSILSTETYEIACFHQQMVLTGNPDNMQPIDETIVYSNECVEYYQ